MNKETFDHVFKEVTDANYPIEKSEYNENAFGSWYICLNIAPRRRLVWDGKEHWLVAEEETSENFKGVNKWKDIWIDRHPNNDSIQIGIKFLCGDLA
jgi:hypothetical protein